VVTAKITLYSEDKLISEVKSFAKEHNTSVSKLVNGFFHTLLSNSKEEKSNYKITNSLLGILKDSNIDEDDYKNYKEDKYL
jgi:hypothetical protein